MSAYDLAPPSVPAPVAVPVVPVATPAPVAPVALPAARSGDDFARIAGADTTYGLTSGYAEFNVDPSTREVKVTVRDQSGQVLRLIPASSVSEMVRAMSAYPRR